MYEKLNEIGPDFLPVRSVRGYVKDQVRAKLMTASSFTPACDQTGAECGG